MSSWLMPPTLLLALVLFHGVDAVLPTAEISVYLQQHPKEGFTTTSTVKLLPSYTLLASQASFGSYPSMTPQENPLWRVVTPPSDDPLLCNSDTSINNEHEADADDATVFLVPRGDCTFEQKAYQAQQVYGAKGIIVYGTLASRYSLNMTSDDDATKKTPTQKDIVYPRPFEDYDCSKGETYVSDIQWEPLPYNAAHNDPILSPVSDTTVENICTPAHFVNTNAHCPSQACLITGPLNTTNGQYQACCAWDLHVWLYGDPTLENETYYGQKEKVVIPAVYVTMEQGRQLLQDLDTFGTLHLVVSQRWRSSYNVSAILIWMLGVAVAAMAAYLSAGDYHGHIRRVLRKRQQQQQSRLQRETSSDLRRPGRPTPLIAPEDTMELTAQHALVFIVMASTSLLILFYFKIYNVVKIMYALGCSNAVSQVILHPLLRKVMKRCGIRNAIVWRTGSEEFGDITLRALSAHVLGYAWGLAWLIMAFTVRHAETKTFFWITQDIFGAAMCIMFLQAIKLNSIHVASILLLVAFFYDIFFVFVTPLLFKGKSVMITVATSGGPPKADPSWCEKYPDDPDCQGGDPLPMLFTIPYINDYQGGSSLLGLGDIVLPGLLISFAARFDAAKSLLGVMGGGNGALNSHNCPERRFCGNCLLCSGGYFVPLVIAYAIGLFMANAAVYLMHMGQPALLYLVPCCLGTMAFMGWRRGELKELWEGPKSIRAADDVVYGEYSSQHPESRSLTMQDHQPLPTDEEGLDENAIPEPTTAAEPRQGDNPVDSPLLNT